MTLAALLLAPTLILIFVLLESANRDIERQFRHDSLAAHQIAAARLNQVVQEALTDLNALAGSRQVTPSDPFGSARMMRTFYLGRRELLSVFAADTRGEIFSSSHNLNAAQSVSLAEQPFLAEVIGHAKPTVVAPIHDPVSNQAAVLIAVPLRNERGSTTGMLAMTVSVFRLTDVLEQLLSHGGDRLVITDAAGEPIVSTGWRSAMDEERWLSRIAEGAAGAGGDPSSRAYGGSLFGPEELMVTGAIAETPFKLFLIREDGPGPLVPGPPPLRAAGYTVLGLIAALVAAARIGAWMSMPLEALTVAVGRIARGHFDADVVAPGHNAEIQRLVDAFNVMAASLREREALVAAQKYELKHYSDQLGELLAQVLDAQEEERRRISADLHDSVAQQLIGVHYEIQAATGLLKLGNSGDAAAALARATTALRDASGEMHRVVHALRPPKLESDGLGAALIELCRSYVTDPPRIDVRVMVEGEAHTLPWSGQVALYRVAQESLNNAWKHAPGSVVEVRLRHLPAAVELDVRDNGPGFDLRAQRARKGASLGLIGMRERIEQAKGRLTIRSRPGHGTRVTVQLPREEGAGEPQATEMAAGTVVRHDLGRDGQAVRAG